MFEFLSPAVRLPTNKPVPACAPIPTFPRKHRKARACGAGVIPPAIHAPSAEAC